MSETNYLLNMPTDIVNQYGLAKTLLTRRETIYLKHILKNLFIYGSEEELNKKINDLQFKSLFDYMSFITNKLRSIYKLPRSYKTENADALVKEKRDDLIGMLKIYKQLNPIIILDFDQTITNANFHKFYQYLSKDEYKIIINSANPQEDVIRNYLVKYKLNLPNIIYSNKGKQKKIVKLKDIVLKNRYKTIFYIDDEEEYLDYGCLLGMYCYRFDKQGKLHNYTIFKK
jgi:hypothetical protein